MVGNIEKDLSNTREVPSFLAEMVENNELGIRTNKGFYDYDDNGANAIHTRDDHFLDLLKLQQQKANKEKVTTSRCNNNIMEVYLLNYKYLFCQIEK